MYHVHSVRAFVCRNLPRGEADASVELAVEGLGFVRAVAKGIRFEKSKSRYAATELSFIECELVRGKEVWRMIKARVATDAPAVASRLSADARRALARAARLVYTVCDEDASDTTYRALATLARSLASGAEPDAAELLAAARILNALGYLDSEPFPFLDESYGEASAIAVVAQQRLELAKAVNHAIRSATG